MGSEIVIATPDADAIRVEYSPLVARAAALEVATQEQHADAGMCLRDLRGAGKRVKERLDPIIQDAHRAHKGLTSLRADLLRPIEEADRIVSRKMDGYEAEQRRIADEARRAAEEAARKQAEERQLMEAIEAEEAGDTEEAEAILEAPVETPVVNIAPAISKVQGVSSRTGYHAEVTDLDALIRYVAEHHEWSHLLTPNMPALNGLARSQRDALSIPGVRSVAETVRSVRA